MTEFICNSRCYFNSCDDCRLKVNLLKPDQVVVKLSKIGGKNVRNSGKNYRNNGHGRQRR